MQRIALAIVFVLFGCTLQAQYYWDYGIRLGGTNSLTDMGGKEQIRRDFVMDMKLSQTRWAVGGFVRYRINDYFAAAVGLDYGRIQGSDALSTNKGRVGRNLSFRNDIIELNARGDIHIFTLYDVGNRGKYRSDMLTFAFLGIGGAYSNPKALNTEYSSKYVALRPLMTEGVKYSAFQLVIPVGFGLGFTYKERGRMHRFGFEFGWRLTFTDYLDDVSTNYSDPANYDPAIYYAFVNRTDEVEGMDDAWASNYGPANIEGTDNYDPSVPERSGKRGDSSHNDNYLFMQFTYSYSHRSKGGFYRQKYRYLGGRSRGFTRVRAKF
jgi:hypothetical protein